MAYFMSYVDANGTRHYTVNIWNDVQKTVTSIKDHMFGTKA